MKKFSSKMNGLRLNSGLLSAMIVLMIPFNSTVASEINTTRAVPDYGNNDCVSFKYSADTNPLNFTFGYACVSENFCEVSEHGCVDEDCQHSDYSRGVRTTLTHISMTARVDQISLGAMGEDLASHAQWCLVQDGVGNYWALDKQRGTSELFSLDNQKETVIACKDTDYFHSELGCMTGAAAQ